MKKFLAVIGIVGDAFAGVKRLRLANEGALRNNIDALVRRLAEIPAR